MGMQTNLAAAVVEAADSGVPEFDRPVPRDGYAWWYVDAISDDGRHAITLIAFIGSVFSPYYAWARRSGPADPENHCSLNVALYGESHTRWAMTERGRAALRRDAATLQIGRSALQWSPGGLTVQIHEWAVPLPRPVRGTVKLYPEAQPRRSYAIHPEGRHRWTPLAPIARVEVDLPSPGLRWSGTGYLDMNTGAQPLERDFVRWDWSCARTRDGAAVLYDVTPRQGPEMCLGARFGRDGSATGFAPPPRVKLPRTLWQVPRSIRAEDNMAHVRRTFEDTPFYARSEVASVLGGEGVLAMHESLALDRFKSGVVQAMLPFRMPRLRGA